MELKKNRVIMYDWDGTLADTIIPTAVFFNDIFERFKKTDSEVYPIPLERSKIRKIFNKATMAEFLIEHGFTEQETQEAYSIYQEVFSKDKKYRCYIFQGVREMLRNVGKGARQLVVSSNVKDNIMPILQRNRIHPVTFGQIIDGDELKREHGSDKANYIKFYLGYNHRMPDEITYVGDTPDDYAAAMDAEVNFIPVNYGWGHFEIPAAESVEELEEILLEQS
jgi:phosphoglycolate phosphatase-like HAD superfamily hydrolase